MTDPIKLTPYEKKLLANPPRLKPYGLANWKGKTNKNTFPFEHLRPEIRPKAIAKYAEYKERFPEKFAANPKLYHSIYTALACKFALGKMPSTAVRRNKWASLQRGFILYPDLLRKVGAPAAQIEQAEKDRDAYREHLIRRRGVNYDGFTLNSAKVGGSKKKVKPVPEQMERSKWLPLD